MDLFQFSDSDMMVSTSYSPALVLLSVLIAMFSSVIALQMVGVSLARPLRKRDRQLTLMIGGLGLGAGTWSMHFIGMLAFEMAMPVSYRPGLTLLSMVPATLASWMALNLIARREVSGWPLVAGGVLVGGGIGLMHYSGMAAMDTPAMLRYDAPVFLLSVAVAVVLSVLALWIRFGLDRWHGIRLSHLQRDVVAGAVMGLAISTMHYTGMAAARFVAPAEVTQAGAQAGQPQLLAGGVTLTTVIITALVIMGHLLLRYRSALEQRRIVEERLLENEARFRSLISNIPGAAYRCLPNERWDMIFMSDAVEDICGWPPGEFMMPDPGRSWVDLVHQDDRGVVAHHESDIGRYQIEYRIHHRDGSTRWVLETGDCICDPEGHPEWLDGFIMDITSRKSMEVALREARDRAEQAAEARAAFLANMSHEIRTPMNAIIGFTDVLLRQDVSRDERQRYLESISRASRSLLHLLNDILDSARMEKGKLVLDQQPFSLHEVLDAVVSTLWLQAREKGLEINLRISPDVHDHYLGAEDRIRQILMNLMGNAVKFTYEGQVSLEVEPTDDGRGLTFRVSDTGIGMDETHLATIFEPFTQADASVSRRFGGTGLGTTISKQLVEMMGGSITAESQPGAGSRFTFSLPLEPSSAPEAGTREGMIGLPPLRILAVDDLQQNLDLLMAMLSGEGHSVDCAGNGRQAVSMALAETYDVILMDIQMPEMDGLSATKELHREQDALARVRTPVVALTASVLVADRDAAREAGMAGFAGKPIDRAALSGEIARAAGIHATGAAESQVRETDGERPDGLPFDMSKGAELWGSSERYREELLRFVRERGALFSSIQESLGEGNLGEVLRTAHTLKGISGNLALTALYCCAASLESSAREEDMTAAVKQSDRLQRAWREFRSAMQRLSVPEPSTRPDTPRPVDHGALREAIRSLQAAVLANEQDEAALVALREAAGEVHSATADRIVQASDNFDFARIREELRGLEEMTREQRG